MTQAIAAFLTDIARVHSGGKATEHSYRPALQALFNALSPEVTATNEPKREKFGAPDFIFERKGVTIAHVEAKDLHIGLRGMKDANKDQQDRYRRGFPNLVYTNGLDWDFYRNGTLTASVTIADLLMGIQPRADQFAVLDNLLRDTIAQTPQTITSPRDLAERMAGKAGLIKDVLFRVLAADADLRSDLAGQFTAFREQLIHDITPADFADIYAETIAYGMFAARLHDTTLDTFSRVEALELLPKSNPFLRSLFSYIAGPDLDENIRWIIDDLAAVFRAADVHSLMQGFGKLTGQQDPFLHFYETFLAAYNPAKRKARGVWYTPEPVVNFIVRAVDDVLKEEFGIADGLADTGKVQIDWDLGQLDAKGKPIRTRKDVHRVQILDPATGTGTFLAEVIKLVSARVKSSAPGSWSDYVERDLIPRLHGFELLMASYAMCHMKLDMILTELGYKPTGTPPRLGVYLTNSLEEGQPANQTLPFAQWLSNEVKAANTVKRDMPIMCVIGNPPYLGEGGSKKDWIGGLLEAYKREPGGKEKLKERNPKWINDLYVKFIRLSEHLIDRTGEGVLGFITNHGYLDNPTFRGMRWHLLKTFDKIYVLDLHGNSKKKEVAPDGSPDKNVFDIQQGVAIIIAVKKKQEGKGEKPLAEVFHGELWGTRATKYEGLFREPLDGQTFERIETRAPAFLFHKRDFDVETIYARGFSLDAFCPQRVLGFQTHRDAFAINDTVDQLRSHLTELSGSTFSDEQLHQKNRTRDNRDWKLSEQRRRLREDLNWEQKITRCLYRPFDSRWCHLDYVTMDYPRTEIVTNFLGKQNLAFLASRQLATIGYRHIIATNLPAESCAISLKTKEQNQVFPLYLYPTEQDLDQSRRINFDPKLYARLQSLATHPTDGTPDEVQVFDYIYGVLHCPAYRATYAEFLKIDFPRIPWPASPEEFWDVSAKGTQLRRLHLMEPAAIGDTPYPFLGDGDGTVDKPRFEDGKVWINATQYFDAAPAVSWTFYIGGYQPAQKWLKDRKGRVLSYDDIRHYQRILKILAETDRIMRTITMTLGGDITPNP